jgi:pimeloyl-ACP methyl ester carboxylesterase
MPAPVTGYAVIEAPVGDLRMYYEIHGAGGTPLLLLHGGLFDIDRPLRSADLASDVVGLLRHLDVPQVDVFGFSVGGATALHLAIEHPDLVRKLIVSSAAFHPDGMRPENKEAVGGLMVDMIAGTPMEQAYRAKSPHPDRLQTLLDKLGGFDEGVAGWSDADIEGISAPTLITVGDCDAVRLDHALRFLRLRGGDVNGDFAGVPASQLAVLPGTTHFFGLARPALVLDVVLPFLDAEMSAEMSSR